jgi:hypothetical protein
MSSYSPGGSSAQQWIYITQFSTFVCATLAITFVAEPIKLMTFLGWETAVLIAASISMVLSLLGIYAAYTSRSGRTTSFFFWNWFGVFSFYQTFALLYLSLHTIVSQPLAFTELKHHWTIVAWRFPQFNNLNQTDAIVEAEEYYNHTVTVIGVLSVLLFLLSVIAVGCIGRTINVKVLYANLLSMSSVLAALCGSVLVGFGVLQLQHQEFYGVRAYMPVQIFTNAFLFLGIAACGIKTIRAKSDTLRCSWCFYFWWIVMSFLSVAVCGIASWLYLENQFLEMEQTNTKVVHTSNTASGLPNVEWSITDFKKILNSHFSQIFALLTFLGLTLCSILTMSIYVRMHENKTGYRAMRIQ